MNMFISHLDGSERSPVQLKCMEQSLCGIRFLMHTAHTPSQPIQNCACYVTLASNWPRILDCAELILDADFDGACVGHDHLEKQIAAVLHTATGVTKLVQQIHRPFGRRTARIASMLLMRQDSHAIAPWSNEETLCSLYSCDLNKETLSYLLETISGDLGQIIDMLAARLRLLSKEVLTVQAVLHMERVLFLTGHLIRAYGFRRRAPENVKAIASIAKSLLCIATAINAPAMRNDDAFRTHASIAITTGLMLYGAISGYHNLPLAIAIVRLGLFDVVLAVHAPLTQLLLPEERQRNASQLLDPVLSRFLPPFLLYGSFVQVVAAALRPLVADSRLRALEQSPFASAWGRFERLLLERYVMKTMWGTEAKHFNVHGVCCNVSSNHAILCIR